MYGYLGFIFGFLLGSAPAFIISHLILYKGFSKLWKSAIPYAALVVVVIGLTGVCNYDILGYNRFLPSEESIKSAGLIDLGKCYCAKSKGALGLANMAADDYDDSENIGTITKFHRSAIDVADAESYEKFASVWRNLFLSNIPSEYIDNSYCVAYRLNNGRLVYRYYDSSYVSGLFGESRTLDIDTAKKITDSYKYFTDYSTAMNADLSDINTIEFSFHFNNNDVNYDSQNNIGIVSSENVDETTAKHDRELVLEAYRKDVREKGKITTGEYIGNLCLTYYPEETGGSSLFNKAISVIDGGFGIPEIVPVYSDHTNTLEALKEAGILTSDNKLNKNSEYYKNRSYTWYEGYEYY
jgi:ABC-2 type transport system permease protein